MASHNKKTGSTACSASHDDTTNMAREYEFFVSTNEPHQPEGAERGMIRRLVMRNFFETKLAGRQASTSENNSASTVMAKKQLKSRFRLPKPEQAKEMKRRDSKQEQDTPKQRRPKVRRTLSGVTDAGEIPRSEKCLTGSPKELATQEEGRREETVKEKKHSKRLVLKINPNSHRFDPFDVLPVPGTPQLDILFKLCKPSSRYNVTRR